MSNRYARMGSKPSWQTIKPPRPKPANDNRPPVRPPVPANDNTPGHLKLPPGVTRKMYMRALGRVALRMVPVVGTALTAYEALQLAGALLGMLKLPSQAPQGYTLFERCIAGVTGPSGGLRGYSSTASFNCGTGNWTSVNNVSLTPEWPATMPVRVYEWWNTVEFDPGYHPSFPRTGRHARWDKNPTGPYAPPKPDIIIPPQPFIPFIPWIDPLTPPLQPMPVPVPPPVRGPRPSYPPSGAPPVAPPDPWAPPEYVRPPIGHQPAPMFPGDPSSGYGPKPQTQPNPGPNGQPLPSSPGRGTKERKLRFKSSLIRRVGGKLLSEYSEMGDFVDALYDALPDELQSKKDKTMEDKFRTLYRHWDKVAMDEAVINLINNSATDKYYGEAFGWMQEGLESMGLEVGQLRGIGGTSGPW